MKKLILLATLLLACAERAPLTPKGWVTETYKTDSGQSLLVVEWTTDDAVLRDSYHSHRLYCLPTAVVEREGTEIRYNPKLCSEDLIDAAKMAKTVGTP